MQILLLTPLSRGGMVHYASQLANALHDYVEVTQVVGAGADRNLWDEDISLVEVDFPSSLDEAVTYTHQTLPQLYRRLLSSDVDVVHLTGRHFANPSFYPAVARKPFVYTMHDVYQHLGEFSYLNELLDRVVRVLADRIVVHGEYNLSQYRTKYSTTESVVSIPHGEYSFFRNYCTAPIEYRPELLFFGRIRDYKGIGTLLEAERLIDEPEYELVIAGSGEFDERLTRDREHVRVNNEFISNRRACELFSRCRAVVLPYEEASQSGIVPIAYGFQKPVITTSVGGLPEVVFDGETGFVVDSNDPEALALRCSELLGDREYAKRLGERGYQFSQRHLSWDRIARTLVTEYESIT